VLRSAAEQQPVARQRLGIRVMLGSFEFLKVHKGIGVGPAMLIWLSQSAPPDFISETKRPGRMIGRQPN